MRLEEHNNTAKDYKRARILRNEASPIERKLWRVLRELAALKNLKFRRQQAIHPYIADFGGHARNSVHTTISQHYSFGQKRLC